MFELYTISVYSYIFYLSSKSVRNASEHAGRLKSWQADRQAGEQADKLTINVGPPWRLVYMLASLQASRPASEWGYVINNHAGIEKHAGM